MIQTILLVLFQIGSIYFSINNIKRNTNLIPMLNFKNLLRELFAIGLMMPILEEALFRGVLKQYLADYTYGNIINSLLFGIAHAQNILVSDINIVLYQIVCASYIGYYLVELNNFGYAFLIHSGYNILCTLMTYLYFYYNKDGYDNSNSIKIGDTINTRPLFTSCFSIKCPNITRDDMIKCGGYHKINKINKEMKKRINKLSDIDFKRKYKLLNDVCIY